MVCSTGQPNSTSISQIREKIPVPSHRHAMPSGPWPWMDLATEECDGPVAQLTCQHKECQSCFAWLNYPQSHFPNWTSDQVARSAMMTKSQGSANCRIFLVDVKRANGNFEGPTEIHTDIDERALWTLLSATRPRGLRVRAFFIENITMSVLKMFGSLYTIEPFFFSSALNWIPSRYQENVQDGKGDHITVTLTFLRPRRPGSRDIPHGTNVTHSNNFIIERDVIDTQAPLVLRSGRGETTLVLDTLALHMVRDAEDSTIISYHPSPESVITPTRGLHARFCLAGKSVYWRDISQNLADPTFLFLVMLWYAVYAWDEALEQLYNHICELERVIDTKNMEATKDLHIIRAHLLHYASLLTDFRKTVKFILETHNPAISTVPEETKKKEFDLLRRECDQLLAEIERLEMFRAMQDWRLQNIIDLAFSLVNLEDSKYTQELMETTIRDGETMKIISYLTMLFVPAIFVAGIFSMNVQEVVPGTKGTLANYFITVVGFTIITVWIIVAFQSKYLIGGHGPWVRFGWPVIFVRTRILGQKLLHKES